MEIGLQATQLPLETEIVIRSLIHLQEKLIFRQKGELGFFQKKILNYGLKQEKLNLKKNILIGNEDLF